MKTIDCACDWDSPSGVKEQGEYNMELNIYINIRRPTMDRPFVYDNLFRVCQVFCVSFKKIFWGGEPPHLYHPTLLNDTLLKCFGNISNRVSCQ